MIELESSAEQEVTGSSSSSVPPATQSLADSFSESYLSNLASLVSLHDAGEPVVFPDGLSIVCAKQILTRHHVPF